MKNSSVPNSKHDAEPIELNNLLLQSLSPITPTAKQSANLHDNLLQQISRSLAEQQGIHTVRRHQGKWQTLKSGIRFKALSSGSEGNSVLIEFAPGASLAAHRHEWQEEGMLLSGRLQMGTLDLGVGDYHRSEVGSRHAIIRSQQGAVAFLRGTSLGTTTSVVKELLGGLLPDPGKLAHTVLLAQTQDWVEIYPGVCSLTLCSAANTPRISRYLRLQHGATYPAHPHQQDEECMVLQGEAFFGDTLLRAGEYQFAAAGSQHGEIFTDVGCLLFMRGEN